MPPHHKSLRRNLVSGFNEDVMSVSETGTMIQTQSKRFAAPPTTQPRASEMTPVVTDLEDARAESSTPGLAAAVGAAALMLTTLAPQAANAAEQFVDDYQPFFESQVTDWVDQEHSIGPSGDMRADSSEVQKHLNQARSQAQALARLDNTEQDRNPQVGVVERSQGRPGDSLEESVRFEPRSGEIQKYQFHQQSFHGSETLRYSEGPLHLESTQVQWGTSTETRIEQTEHGTLRFQQITREMMEDDHAS